LKLVCDTRNRVGVLSVADSVSGGTKQFICSEVAIRAYNDAGYSPSVKYWPLADMKSTGDRKRDYTTPNGLWMNGAFTKKGSLLH